MKEKEETPKLFQDPPEVIAAFQKLGYVKKKGFNEYHFDYVRENSVIEFCTLRGFESVGKYFDDGKDRDRLGTAQKITIDEIKAIKKKCKEMGWFRNE